MHVFGKAFLLTVGCSLLILQLVFFLVLKLDLVSLENFAAQLSNFKFVGYNISELMGLEGVNQTGEAIFKLKIYLFVTGLLTALLLIGVSYLGNVNRQLKLIAIWFSFLGFFLVFSFWLKFIDDEKIIGNHDETVLLSFTLLTYLPSSVLLWFGIREPSIKHISRTNQGQDDWIKPLPSAQPTKPSNATEDKQDVDSDGSMLSNSSEEVDGSSKDEQDREQQKSQTNSAESVALLEPLPETLIDDNLGEENSTSKPALDDTVDDVEVTDEEIVKQELNSSTLIEENMGVVTENPDLGREVPNKE